MIITKESHLMQDQYECKNTHESIVNIYKSFQKVFINTKKIFIVVPDHIKFLQMGRYEYFSE